MNVQEFEANHYEDGEVFSDDGNIQFKRVDSKEHHNHKTVTCIEVFHLLGTEDYFKVSTDRDDCGYWGDGERYDPEFRKVVPRKRVVEITEWENAA